MAYDIITDENQTEALVRALRRRLGDTEKEVYLQDDQLAQALLDAWNNYVLVSEATESLIDTTDLDDPLATTTTLPTEQRLVWLLLAAIPLIQAEYAAAVRRAAFIKSPAATIDARDTPEALARLLQDLNYELLEAINPGGLPALRMMDLTTLDGRFDQQ